MASEQRAMDIVDLAKAATAEIDSIRTRLETVVNTAEDVRRTDPIPTKFYGIVRRYRFSTRGDDGKFEMPSHRFEVECGAGLWLYCNCPVGEFEKLFNGMQMDEFTNMGKFVNGKVIELTRNGGTYMEPTMLVGEPFSVCDARGMILFKGATVLVRDQYIGTAIDADSMYVRVSCEDGLKSVDSDNLIRL